MPLREVAALRRFAEDFVEMVDVGLHLETEVGWMRKAISPDLHRAKAAVVLNTMSASDACLQTVNGCA